MEGKRKKIRLERSNGSICAVDRQIEFDIARGIAITAVVFSHNGGILLGGSMITPYYIALFFVIAGYFYRGGEVYRVYKLGNTYLQYNFFLFLISLFTERQLWVHNLIGVLYGRYCLYPFFEEHNIIFLTISNHPLWFLLALALATLLFGALLPKLDTSIKKVTALIILVIISWGFLYLPILLPWSIDTVSVFTIFMMVGYWMRQYSLFTQFYQSKLRYVIFLLLVIIYCILKMYNRGINIAVRLYGGENKLHNVVIYILIGIMGSFLCITVCNVIKNSIIGKVFAIVGKHTLPILGLHVFLYEYINKIFSLQYQVRTIQYRLEVVIKNIMIICICIAVDILLQKRITSNN